MLTVNRLKSNTFKEYGDAIFLSNSINKKINENNRVLIAKDLYIDEAVIIADALNRDKIYYNINKEDYKYDISIDKYTLSRDDKKHAIIFALRNIIMKILQREIKCKIGDKNYLQISEEGILEEMVFKSDYKSCTETINKLIEYTRNIFFEE